MVPKPSKDPEKCASYRPISLIKEDAKLLAKILALRLATVIKDLIHQDQTGFMPRKGMDINIRRLLTCIPLITRVTVIPSLDTEKAFDSMEWKYLCEVLKHFGFGPEFLAWLGLLYKSPKAWIRMNDILSDFFLLQRCTRQGCSLSPSLFALALEPLAILIRRRKSHFMRRMHCYTCMMPRHYYKWHWRRLTSLGDFPRLELIGQNLSRS